MPVNAYLGYGVNIFHPELVNIYGCTIGDNTTVGPFVEIQAGVTIGKNCKISSHSFICGGVTIGDGCFIGHGVIFINDKNPQATNKDGKLAGKEDWTEEQTIICDNVSIGSRGHHYVSGLL